MLTIDKLMLFIDMTTITNAINKLTVLMNSITVHQEYEI